jgi:excisionase family DNA binding protein
MATKFVVLDEAAKMLGLSPEQLVEMRSNGQIHGYRDGASWKFKLEELERIKSERASPARGREGDDEESILVSDQVLEPSPAGRPSTVIGKSGDATESGSDLKLAPRPGSDLKLAPGPGGSDLTLEGSRPTGSDVTLVPGAGVDSDVSLVPDPGSDRAVDSLTPSDLELPSGGTGRLESVGSGAGIGSSDLDVSLDSELALSDDDDVVLAGSDLTLGAADSGINLATPSDSGLSLEADSGINLQTPTDSGLSLEDEAIDMGGSSISSLELGEGEAAAEEAPAAGVKKDEEFSLSPSEDMFADESDSGSQVIAIEESGPFEQESTIPGGGVGLLEETTGLEQQIDTLSGAQLAPARMAPAYGGMAELPEAPYSAMNVTGLLVILLLLSVGGILLTDVVQNMWAWHEARDASTGISDGIASMIFGK